jgi:hypothetical protein
LEFIGVALTHKASYGAPVTQSDPFNPFGGENAFRRVFGVHLGNIYLALQLWFGFNVTSRPVCIVGFTDKVEFLAQMIGNKI